MAKIRRPLGPYLLIGIGWLSASSLLYAEDPAETLTLEAYLASVRDSNKTLRASVATISAGELRTTSPDIMFSPQFFSQATHTIDEKPVNNPLAPTRIEATQLSFGIQKLWESGLQSQVSFNMTKVNLDQPDLPETIRIPFSLPNPLVAGGTLTTAATVTNPLRSVLPQTDYTEARTQIDLVQPLWKNAQGRDAELLRESTLTKISMQTLGERFKSKSLMAQAEAVYWQLALAQEAVRTQEGSIARFQKIRDWAKQRANSQLGDKADFLQADSGLRVKQFELEQAKKDRNALQRVFNTLRNVPGDEGEVKLSPLSAQALMNFAQKQGAEIKRLDVEAAKQAVKLADVEVEQSREKYKAQLDVFGSAAFNSLEKQPDDAIREAVQTKNPTYVVGLKFSTPLDHDIINRDREGLIRTSQAAKLDAEAKQFAAQQEWDDLLQQLKEAETRLRLSNEIEVAQKEKLNYEKQRLSVGRTTTYQTLLFEQDYANAQLATIKAKADILGIVAKLKSYGDDA